MGQITATRNLVAIKVVRHAGQLLLYYQEWVPVVLSGVNSCRVIRGNSCCNQGEFLLCHQEGIRAVLSGDNSCSDVAAWVNWFHNTLHLKVHDSIMTWECFLCYWHFMKGIRQWVSLTKGQYCFGAFFVDSLNKLSDKQLLAMFDSTMLMWHRSVI